MAEELVKLFSDTIRSEVAYETITQIGDVSIDAIIDEGVLDGVPIFGLLKSFYKLTKNFQWRGLIRKVYRFIFNTQDTSLEERLEFIKEYTEKNKEDGCESLLAIIDKLDNINKVDILSNLMKAKINGSISINDFIRLCAIVDRVPYPDFDGFSKYAEDYYEEGSSEVLLGAGVLFNTIINSNEDNKYRLNSLGIILLKYGLLSNVQVEAKRTTRIKALEWGHF